MVYDGVLAVIVVVYFVIYYPTSKLILSIDSVLFLFLLAVVANVASCVVYVVDIFVLASGYREQWRKYRRVIFTIGLLFAAVITRFLVVGMFQSESMRAH